MPTRRIATAPNGERWKVGRRWMARPLSSTWRGRWPGQGSARNGDGILGNLSWFDPPSLDGADDLLIGILVVVAAVMVVALVAFVLLPLLGVALELAVVLSLSASGALGSVFLGRPWTIEAVRVDGTGSEPATFAVKGWRRSGQAIRAVARAIEQTGRPPALADPVPSPAD